VYRPSGEGVEEDGDGVAAADGVVEVVPLVAYRESNPR